VVAVLAFLSGALQLRSLPSAYQLSAYDGRGTRRFALTLSSRERPDIAVFDARGQRFIPALPR
jgi:hypothetical protein